MRAGALDRQIEIISITASPVTDNYGQPVTTETSLGTFWAQITYQTAKEVFRSGITQTSQQAAFTIRWLDGITTDHIVRYQGQDWNIQGIVEIGRRRGLELQAVLRA